uniref:CTNNB1_binding domain-containing protein n=1 Tax=Hymenolepis diminuta TaxID=6216 RepID=A0A0R3SNK5_HYMDI
LVVKDGSVDSSGEQNKPSEPGTNTGGSGSEDKGEGTLPDSKPSGPESGGSDNNNPDSGDSGNNNESGDKNEDETTSQTTTSKASSHSQGKAFLLSSFFIAYPILH